MAKLRDDVTWFESPDEWQRWLAEHHETAAECWVGCRKVHVETGITYREALDEALCFGWIDGVRHTVDADGFAQRFTRRTARSPWSEVNRMRMDELLAEDRVHPAGIRAWEQRDLVPGRASVRVASRSAELEPVFQERFESAADAWDWFQAQPPGYRRQVVWWVMEAKRPETRERRFARLLADSQAHRRVDGVG